ncbi:MAG: Sec-independent protein translocase protein TatB [Pseudomonadota bacterium]
MLDIGWSELMVIGVLALLVVGPKELPGLFRTVGQYVGKARSVAREFQRSMEDAARDVDGGAFDQLRDAKRDFDKMARADFSDQAKKAQNSLMSGGKKPSEGAGSKVEKRPAPTAEPQPAPDVKPADAPPPSSAAEAPEPKAAAPKAAETAATAEDKA